MSLLSGTSKDLRTSSDFSFTESTRDRRAYLHYFQFMSCLERRQSAEIKLWWQIMTFPLTYEFWFTLLFLSDIELTVARFFHIIALGHSV